MSKTTLTAKIPKKSDIYHIRKRRQGMTVREALIKSLVYAYRDGIDYVLRHNTKIDI